MTPPPPRAPITWPDLLALLRDSLSASNGKAFDEWVAREGFEDEALVRAIRFISAVCREQGSDIEIVALFAFTAGWDAHRDLRGERA